MRKLSNALFTTLTRLDGCRFKGFLTTPLKEDNVFNRVLSVKKPALVKVGDVVNGPGGTKMLLLDHPDDQEWNTNFRVAFINAQYTWERQVKVIDPVARVAKDFQKIEIGKIYAYLFSPKDVQIGLMHDTQYSFYTGE